MPAGPIGRKRPNSCGSIGSALAARSESSTGSWPEFDAAIEHENLPAPRL